MGNTPIDGGLKDITDPSDWKQTRIPLLSQLESLQRCYICKEFLSAPVVTSCNHTFCSTCIRQHLMEQNTCPLCKSEQFESNLRRVVVLEEIVNCFTSLRPYILAELSKNQSDKAEDDSIQAQRITPDKSSEGEEMFSPSKRKLESSSSANSSVPDVVVISDEEDQRDKRKQIKLDSGEAQCPICSKWMDSSFLQTTHIDNCLNGKSSIVPKDHKPKWKKPSKPGKKEISSFFKPMKAKDSNDALKINHSEFYFNNPEKHNQKEPRLPKLDFNSLTLNKLKEKLSTTGLSTAGSRPQLELRYNQYYILYNSNLDSSHPVDTRVLKSRLNKWESAHSAFTNGTSSNLFSNANSRGLSSKSITDKNFPIGQWKRIYAQEFKELKQQALANRASKNPSQNPPHPDLPFESSPLFVGDDD